MGIGTSMKETSLHYYRDPLVEVLSEDQDVNLRGIIIVGSPDKNEDKYLSAERVGVTLECARRTEPYFPATDWEITTWTRLTPSRRRKKEVYRWWRSAWCRQRTL